MIDISTEVDGLRITTEGKPAVILSELCAVCETVMKCVSHSEEEFNKFKMAVVEIVQEMTWTEVENEKGR